MFNLKTLPPLALYVHFPWCVRKCPYCDFNSHEQKTELPQFEYVDALIADLTEDLPRVWGRRVESVFFGGGTPSLFSPEALDRLLSQLRALIPLNANAEITLEANPGTIDQARFKEYRSLGINRLSIGVQSFDNELLGKIGRIHDGRAAIRAAEAAHDAGFDNFNLDLMFALPQQTLLQAKKDIDTASALEPTHISYYQLTLEPNTTFYRNPPTLPDDDLAAAIHSAGQDRLAERGYAQYEVSAYARSERQCWHNLNYWRFGDYLGIGAGAHGKISDPVGQRILRLSKTKHPKAYLSGTNRLAGEQVLTQQDLATEFMLNALRLNDGFETPLFTERTGLPISVIERPLREAESRDLLTWTVQRIAPTEQGRLFLNDLIMLFMD